MKASFEEVSKAWYEAKDTSSSREEFQAKWTAALERLGWTRQEFHEAVDRFTRDRMTDGQEEVVDRP